MMKKFMAAAMVMTGTAVLGGCGNANADSSSAGKVVVVDLQVVAKALGRDVAIQQLIQQNNENLLGQVRTTQTDLSAVWGEEQKKFPNDPTKLSDPQKQELSNKYVELQNRLRQTASQADQYSRNFQLQLIVNFREEVRPIARKIAEKRGASIVMVSADPLLDVRPDVDITEDVIREMRSSAPAMQIPPMAAPPGQQPAAAPGAAPGAAKAPAAATPAPAAPAPAGPKSEKK